jgi:meckelin
VKNWFQAFAFKCNVCRYNLVFTALDSEVGSFAVAAFLTWLIGTFVDFARATFGEANISRKSLIDNRFLI